MHLVTDDCLSFEQRKIPGDLLALHGRHHSAIGPAGCPRMKSACSVNSDAIQALSCFCDNVDHTILCRTSIDRRSRAPDDLDTFNSIDGEMITNSDSLIQELIEWLPVHHHQYLSFISPAS